MKRKTITNLLSKTVLKGCFLLFLALFSTNLTAQITVDVSNKSIKEILIEIETKSEYRFFYNESLKGLDKITSLRVKDATIDKTMLILLEKTEINYKLEKKNLIVLVAKTKIIQSESKKLTGLVTDEKGEPIIGANIILKRTIKEPVVGTITDVNGRFNINAPENGVVIVSYVGYLQKEIPIGNQNILTISLIPDLKNLDEVVVVGYSTQRKEAITGSISSVKAADLVIAPMASTTNTLVGRLPGLISQQKQGVPGGDNADLSIRGFGNALIIVDGVESSFNNVDASQIESISILKDASASIYGARAGNGVILVTTKRGVNQKPTITLNSSLTLQGNTTFPRPASSGQEAEMAREAWIQSGKPASTAPFSQDDIDSYYAGNDLNYPNTDWFKVLIKPWTQMQQHDISVRGGTEKLKYYGYLGYVDQPTFFTKNGGEYKRYNLQSNVDAEITKYLSLRVDLSTTIEQKYMPNIDLSTGIESGWLQVWGMDPMSPATLPDPTKIPFNHQEALILTNRNIGGYNDQDLQRFKGTISLEYKLDRVLKGLSTKYFFNYMKGDILQKQFWNPVDLYKYNYDNNTYALVGHFGDKGSLGVSDSKDLTLTNQISINYDNILSEIHRLKVLLLFESIDYKYDNFGASRKDFISPLIQQLYAGSSVGQTVSGSGSEMGRESFVGRLNYTYKDKYLFESSFRADASAKFPANSRWGFFPSVSLGWLINQENFMQRISSIDLLKIRLSYGQSGNDNVGNYDYLAGYTLGNSYLFGDTPNQSIISKGLANPNLTWEKINISNVGIDFSLFQRKLYGEVDVFYRLRSGIPGNRIMTLDPSFGAILPPENINSISNRGFEFKLGTVRNLGKFTYDISGNISWSRARWEHFEEPIYSDPDQKRIYQNTGQWVDKTFGFRSDKLFTSQNQIDNLGYNMDQQGNVTLRPGDVKILDVNGDKVVDWRDKVELGAGTVPHWIGGVDIKLKYKDFDFSGLFQGAFGYLSWVSIPNSMYPYTPAALLYDLRWTEANNNANSLVSRLGGASDGSGSDFKIKDAGYLRLKNFSFGYTLPIDVLNKIGIKQARVYISGVNLLTFSKLNKYQMDPEAPSGQGGYYYPQQKTISLGINTSF